jgi:twinkle protein
MYFNQLNKLGIKIRRRSGQEKTTCPQCSDSRRNKKDPCLSVNITEGTYNCHHCGWKGNVRVFERKESSKKYFRPDRSLLENIQLNEKIVAYSKSRGISRETLQKFHIHGKEEWMPATQKKERCIVFPYIRDSQVVNAKFRDGAKNFRLIKDAELIFFGMQTLHERNCAIITEGEWDMLTAYECGFSQTYEPVANDDGEVVEHELGRWAVLSVPNGASKGNQQLEYLDNCSDYLATIDEFIIATDGDEAGRKLRDELVRRLGVEKCRVLNYPEDCKDLNEVLLKYGKEQVINLLLDSAPIPIDGVYYLEQIFPDMLESFKAGVQLAPTTRFDEMDDYFRWKKGDITLCTGYGNHGKSFFMLQLMLTKSIWDGWKWAIFSPENYPPNDFYDDIVEMYVGKWLKDMNVDEYTSACKFISDHIYYVYPENEHDINSIHEKFRYLILKKGIDGVMIDPFNQLDKTQKAYERDDQYLSWVLKDIKRFALLNNIVYTIIAHPKNPTYNQDRSLPVPDSYDLHGGSMWANKADQILSYYRPKFHEDKNNPDVEVYVQKLKRKRTGGKLGSFPLTLNWQKKRYVTNLGDLPCDPQYAKLKLAKQDNDFVQQDIWRPDPNTDINF